MELYQPEEYDRQQQAAQSPSTYGTYSYTNGQYVNNRYGYQPQPEKSKKKKKESGPVAKVIGVLAVSVLVVAAALLVAFAFLSFRQTGNTGTANVQNTAEGAGNTANIGGTEQIPPTDDGADTESTETTGTAAGEGSSLIATVQSTDKSVVVTDVTQVVENLMPAVVIIDNNFTARQRTIYGVYEEEAMGTGSGVIIGKSDYQLLIVTNNHVISGANSLQVQFMDGERANAEVKGTNTAMDLAVIAVTLADLPESTQNAIKIATLGDSDTLKLGEPVIAIGNALGHGQSVTTGVVSALNREVTMQDGTNGVFIQTDAAINEGNSGGALLNSRGELIGINTAKLGGTTVEGMGFAIPITQAKERIERLMNLGTQIRYNENDKGYFGISVMTPQGIKGAYVQSVQAGSAAEKGGMKEGDIITAVDDLEIGSRDDLLNSLNYYPAGAEITVTVIRQSLAGEQELKLNITLQGSGS